MKARICRSILVLLAVAIAACAMPGQELPSGRPNMLFVLIDDLAYADLSVMGNDKVRTPNIDRLANEGLLMTRFYTASPICSPSRAAFMTGHFPARHRIVSYLDSRQRNAEMGNANWLDPTLSTLPRALKAAGYATGHFGKWHLGGGRDIGDAPLPTEYGFDESFTSFEGLGPRVLLSDDAVNLSDKSAALGRGPVVWRPQHRLSQIQVDKAIDFIGRRASEPWFVQLWLDDIHDPHQPSPAQFARVRGRGDDAAETAFFAVLVEADRQIGRLIDTLERNGELADTLIVLTGDNGPVSYDRYYRDGATPPGDVGVFRGRKWSLYEGGIREPLIVRWPGRIAVGKRDGETVASAVDLFPTLARIAGADGPPDPDGIDLAPAWTGRPILRRPDLLFAYGGFGTPGKTPQPYLERERSPPFAIRSGAWKLLANADGSRPELYNLADDPSETRNLAAARPAITQQLAATLAAWRRTLPQ